MSECYRLELKMELLPKWNYTIKDEPMCHCKIPLLTEVQNFRCKKKKKQVHGDKRAQYMKWNYKVGMLKSLPQFLLPRFNHCIITMSAQTYRNKIKLWSNKERNIAL